MLKVVTMHLAMFDASQPAKTPLGFISRSGRFQCFSKLDRQDNNPHLVGGIPTPLKNDGLRHLGS